MKRKADREEILSPKRRAGEEPLQVRIDLAENTRRSIYKRSEIPNEMSGIPFLMLPRPKGIRCHTLQIKEFFAAPLPRLVCGPYDEGSLLFGAMMEWNLRQLVVTDHTKQRALMIVIDWLI